ncbi:MAG: response regulator, partial [Clostridia bacterium]|nr:response regulator [Clostridia bacterium]
MRKILIAEDNVEISDMMRNYLLRAGHVVYQAFDGEQALDFAKKLTPDLVLLDIMMPIVDGYEVCRKLRKSMDIPIIVVSAKVAEEDKEKMCELGADDYMTKPFSFNEMNMRVSAQLRRYYEFNA